MESKIEELLVALACISNHGCSATTHLYYVNNPKVEAEIKHQTARVNRMVGQDIKTIAPAVFIMAGGKGSFRLNRYMSLDIQRGEAFVSFKYDF